MKLDYDPEWNLLLEKLKILFGKIPDLNALLFLIGVQELGKGPLDFSKEQKQDLMNVGLCTVLVNSGYYKLTGTDNEGWPIFDTLKAMPKFTLEEQEYFIKSHVKDYFKELITNI